MNSYSIDLETLGTNVEDTVLSIGICKFDEKSGEILDTLEVTFDIGSDESVLCNLGTVKFWMHQATINPEAVDHVFNNTDKVSYPEGLIKVKKFIPEKEDCEVWANGTKFDLGMTERLFKIHSVAVPWSHNSDRCMRTLRKLHGHIEIDMGDYSELSHTALSDAIWQAKYIAKCLNSGMEP